MGETTVSEVSAPPEQMAELHLDTLHAEPLAALRERARSLGLKADTERSRHPLTFDLLRRYAERRYALLADGVVEFTGENYGFLRWPRFDFRPGPEDVYVSAPQIKRFDIRPGNRVSGRLRAPRDREKFMALETVTAIEGKAPELWIGTKHFDTLTPTFPTERILLEDPTKNSISARAVDLIAPLGRGQRGLIVAPPRVGKTILLKELALAIRATSPESRVIILLVDERPEEVTDLKREVDAEIYSSTFDEAPARHVQVAELVSERAKRLVEMRAHVIILLDSITRLARGYNALQPAKGRIMSGGVEAKALMKPKRFFGAARNCEEGGSLTILATALIDTHSRMDEVIFEEFKGTGNMELHLDRFIVEQRIFPAIHLQKSATRREELLYHPDELTRVHLMRKQLGELPPVEAMELFLQNLQATKSNAELLMAGLRSA